MKLRTFSLILILLSTISVALAQDGSGTVVDTAVEDGSFTMLISAIEAAGLADTLNGEGPFTIFAPTDAAFGELPAFAIDYLLNNPELLTHVLSYHVVSGALMSDAIEAGSVTTLEGSDLTVGVADMTVTVDQATVTTADVKASNGVIHVIDSVLVPPLDLPEVTEVDILTITENIVTAGSSTVFPLTERMADLFNNAGFAGTITVDSIGSGAGFERFCVNAETDISNASRPIRPEEQEACAGNGRIATPFFVAIDALAISVSAENDFVDNLTLEQLAAIFSGEAATWTDVNPDWPDEQIRLYSPGSDSGTYDYFVEEIFDEDETPIQNAPGIQFSEDDNVLVQGILGSAGAIGYFGFAYYQENQDTLRAVSIEGVEPNENTGASGEYPLSRPLFIYSAPSIMQAKPQVATFINFYLQNRDSQLGTESDQIGYIPTNRFIDNRNRLLWLAATNVDLSN